ncbi:MAG: YezD family protein [Kiritimatiellales bacterium]|nr:YezD family protein [Kiritimatiellales bacterium]
MCEEVNGEKPDYCKTCGGRWVATVKEYVQQLSYGEVNVIVHDGKVVQVEKTEKLRF